LAGLFLYTLISGIGFLILTSHFQDGGHDVISSIKVLQPVSEHEASAWRIYLVASTVPDL